MSYFSVGSHTGGLILNELNRVLKQFGVERKVNAAVTDNGANILNLSLPAFDVGSVEAEEEFLNALVQYECTCDEGNFSEVVHSYSVLC